MDCKTSRLLLHFVRPNCEELDPADSTALKAHLAECSDCAAMKQADRLADEPLTVAMRQVPVPPKLRERILVKLGRERRSRIRRWPLRQPRSAAAAAVLLFALVGFGWYTATRPKPVLDPQILLADDSIRQHMSPEQVELTLAQQGFRTQVPREFEYWWLLRFDHTELPELPGQFLPHLLFKRDDNVADVYVISGRQVDLQASLDRERANSGDITIEIRPHPTDPNIAYLIKYTGGSLEWLLKTAVVPNAA